jgi:HEAT repeat protein
MCRAVCGKHPSKKVRDEVLRLALVFGDGAALDELQSRVLDVRAEPADRVQALEALVQTRRPELVNLLQKSLDDPLLRLSAIRGLAASDNPETPGLIPVALRQDFRRKKK